MILFIFSNQCYSQSVVNKVYNYLTDNYIKENIFSLQKAPKVPLNDIIISKISKLISYGKYFKYHDELLNGKFFVQVNDGSVNIFILKSENNNVSVGSRSAVNDKKILDKIEFGVSQIDDNYYLDIQNGEKLVDVLGLLKQTETDNSHNPPPTVVPFNYLNNILIDKEILNNLTPYVSGKILNRSITTNKMRTLNNQPCQLYADVTAATIVPYNNGANAKVFTVDKLWNRIIWWDRDRSGVDFGPLSLFNPVNEGQYYRLNRLLLYA